MSTITKPKMKKGSLVDMIWNKLDVRDVESFNLFNAAIKDLEITMRNSLSRFELNEFEIKSILGFEYE